MYKVLRSCAFHRFPTRLRLLAIPMFLYYYKAPKIQMIQKEGIQLNQQLFVSDILSNRKDYFFLIIYKEQVDGGYGEREAILVSKQLTKIAAQLGDNVNVYMISRPSLSSISKLVSRVKGIKIYSDEEAQNIEIYFKTPLSDDYVYFPFKKHSFYQDYKQQKILNKVTRFQDLIQEVKNEDELNRIVMQSQYQLDSPLFLKAKSNNQKSMKYFSKLAFQLLERKQLSLTSKFLLIDNPKIIKELNLQEDDILMLRNDILQKYQNCKINQSRIEPQLIEKSDSLYKNVGYESYREWSKQYANPQGKPYQQLYQNMRQFIIPRIIYLKNSKKSAIGNFLMASQVCKNNKEKLILSLHIDPNQQHRFDNQERIQLFFKLYEKYQKEFIFLFSSTNQIEDLLPHLSKFQTNFALFNVYNAIKLRSQYFENPSMIYQKHFLRDSEWVERFEILDQQIQNYLKMDQEERELQTDYLSYDQDRVQEINLDYFNKIQSENKEKRIILYYQGDTMTDALLSIIKNITATNLLFTMSHINQVPALNNKYPGKNVLIINDKAIFIQETNNMTQLREEIQKMINQYL